HLTDTWPLSMISMIRPCMPVLSNTLSPTAGSRGSSFILSQMSPSHRRIGRNRRVALVADTVHEDITRASAWLPRPCRPPAGQLPPGARGERIPDSDVVLILGDNARERLRLSRIERLPPGREDVFNEPLIDLDLRGIFLSVAAADLGDRLDGPRAGLIEG